MPKTIRELADELKVSKQTIQYHYQRLPAKNQQKNSQGTNLITMCTYLNLGGGGYVFLIYVWQCG